MTTKVCSKCKSVKPIDLFAADKRVKSGKSCLCIKCKRELDRQRMKIRQHTPEFKEIKRKSEAKRREKKQAEQGGAKCLIEYTKCVICFKYFIKRGNASKKKTCSHECAVACRAISRTGSKVKPKQCKCRICGNVFIGTMANSTCSACVKKLVKERKRIDKRHSVKQRLKIEKGYIHHVDPRKVFSRDKYMCQICKCKVQKTNLLADNAAEIDHIVPLALGGPHSYSNVQTLCRMCNRIKASSYRGQLVMAI